uniref:PWWP domain-containing protein n=1 Tax=Zea mays TaxID=4577 RepID=A0A804QR15_MAIZE
MADPAAGGAMVPAAGGGSVWANGAPRFGDMVWAKVKSHPWWPGHIYSVSLTDDEEVHRGYRYGLVLVAFFGDKSYGWFEPSELVPFEEHFTEKAAQGGSTRSSFAGAVAEAVDEVARRSALALLCPCKSPDAFRPHPSDGNFLLVDVPAFDTDADYHPDQIQAARQRFVPRKALDYLLDAAVTQRDAAEKAARTVPGMEMAALFSAYRRAVFSPIDNTYAQAFGVDPELALAAEQKAAAERAQRARPLKGGPRKTADQATPAAGRRRGGAGGAAARLMEKIVPGAPAMKTKSSKKDQYLLKRRDAPEASAHSQPQLPDAPPPAPTLAAEDGPPGFPASGDPPTPPLPGSSVADEDFMLQRRVPLVDVPPAVQAQPSEGPAAPKNATKLKKPRKREREEGPDATPDSADAAGDPKKKKKKKKLSDVDGAGGKVAFVVEGRDVLDLTQKSYENDPPEELKSLDKPSAAATDGQSPKKKKPAPRPGAGNDPTKAGVKRGPSDRQGELAIKKKAKLDKIKVLSSEKKAAGLEQKDTAAAAAQQQARAAGAKDKAEMGAAKKKEPASARTVRTPSPTALMMKFPLNSTLPSVASLKARFARFGPLDVDGIRVYWKSHMCRVVYRFKFDAEAALRYAKANAMFGQVDTQYHLREVEAGAGREPLAAPEAAPQQRSELRLMETAAFRPGTSGNGAPLPMSRAGAAPARPAVGVGQPPKSILKKSTDEGSSGTTREVSRVKFVLDGADGGTLAPPPSVGGNGNGADGGSSMVAKAAKSVGFAPSQALQPPPRTLQPPMRPAHQQPPRAAVTQQLPPPPLPQHLPYHQHPRGADGTPLAPPPGQLLAYPPRGHGEGPSALPGLPPPLPYQPRPTGFPGGQQLGYPPRSGDNLPLLAGQPQFPPRPSNAKAGSEGPAWRRGEKEFKEEVWRLMTGIAKMVEPLTDKNGFFPYHLFRAQ